MYWFLIDKNGDKNVNASFFFSTTFVNNFHLYPTWTIRLFRFSLFSYYKLSGEYNFVFCFMCTLNSYSFFINSVEVRNKQRVPTLHETHSVLVSSLLFCIMCNSIFIKVYYTDFQFIKMVSGKLIHRPSFQQPSSTISKSVQHEQSDFSGFLWLLIRNYLIDTILYFVSCVI